MQITFFSFNNRPIQYLNNIKQNNIQKTNLLQPLRCDSVQFTGSKKVLTNEEDNALVYVLSQNLDLDEQQTARLEKVICDFIEKNKINSLSDVVNSDNAYLRKDLIDAVCQEPYVAKNLSDYVMTEIMQRCEYKEYYIPEGMRRYNKKLGIISNLGIDKIFSGAEEECSETKETYSVMNEVSSMSTDDALYSYVKRVLRLSPIQAYELRELVEEYIEDHNLGSIEKFFNNEDFIVEREELMNGIKEHFDFDERDMYILDTEFEQRAKTDSSTEYYKPKTTVYIKDYPLFKQIIKDYGYDYYVDGYDMYFSFLLYYNAACEADNLGCRTLFDFFKSKEFSKSDTLKFINSSRLTQEQKIDIVFDLQKAAKNYEKKYAEYERQRPKNPGHDEYITFARATMMYDKIVKKYDMNVNKVVESDMIEKLMIPPNMTEEERCTAIKTAAFSIYDTYDIPSGAFKEVKGIIEEVCKLSDKEVDAYYQKNYGSAIEEGSPEDSQDEY